MTFLLALGFLCDAICVFHFLLFCTRFNFFFFLMTHERATTFYCFKCLCFLMKFALSLLSNHALANVNEEQFTIFSFYHKVFGSFGSSSNCPLKNLTRNLQNSDEDFKETLSLKRSNGRERNKLEIFSRALYIAAVLNARKKFVFFLSLTQIF